MNQPLVIGYMGRSGKGKGANLLIEVASMVIQRGCDLRVKLAGEHDAETMSLADELCISDRVEFTGWHADVAPFIDSIDVLLLPSMIESFGLVLIEAMARAKPVIATDCNGPASIVEDGKTGYLVPIGDVRAMADAIEKAALDPGLHLKGCAACEAVEMRYTQKPVGKELVRALGELGPRFD